MTDREMDIAVATKIMGWMPHAYANRIDQMQPPDKPVKDGIEQVRIIPHYTTDPAADYAVLVKVRESWDTENQGVFCNALTDSWAMRTWIHGGPLAYLHTAYQPGDYSRAALAALNAHPSDPTT